MSDLKNIASRVRTEHAKNAAKAEESIPEKGDILKDRDLTKDKDLAPDEDWVHDDDEVDGEVVFDDDDDDDISAFEQEMDPKDIEGTSDFEEDDDDDEIVFDGDDDENVEFEEDSAGGISDFPIDDEEAAFEEEQTEFVLSDEEILNAMKEIPEEEAKKFINEIRKELTAYRTNLIARSGLSPDEASGAAMTRLQKIADEKVVAYIKEHPTSVVVSINKENADKLDFTQEERAKMAKSKVIQFKVVEEKEIKEVKIKKISSPMKKTALLESMDRNISSYAVPLPMLNDYVRFRGSQIIQLIQSVRYDDSQYHEIIAKKASLVWSQMVNGEHIKKRDLEGKPAMTYQEFANIFPFHDLDMALYGILVASSMEEIETTLVCSDCNQSFTTKYNMKSLLTMDGLSDEFKERFNDILKHKSNGEYLKNLYNKNNITRVIESPITGIRYFIDPPSVARAINLYATLDNDDETMLYLSAPTLFIHKMQLPAPDGEYIEVTDNEHTLMLNQMKMLAQEEIDLLIKYIQPMTYVPSFQLNSKCTHCGNEMTNDLDIQALVFLRARDSSTEIR